MAINRVSPIASSTAPNWLKEAQEALVAAESAGGMLGALQHARSKPGTIKTYLANSRNAAYGLALIAQGNVEAARDLAFKAAADAYNKRVSERLEEARAHATAQTNYTPPKTLDPVIYFANGSTLDTVKNILTLSDGTQIDAITGQSYVDERALIRMANGAYLDTKNNILVMADGTKIDTVTGLKITA